jgi:hypothetical protein
MFYKKACYDRLLGKENKGRVRVVVGTFPDRTHELTLSRTLQINFLLKPTLLLPSSSFPHTHNQVIPIE